MKSVKFTLKISISVFLFFLLCKSNLLAAKEAFTSAIDVAKSINAELFWDPITEELIFKKNNVEASCKINESLILFDNKKVDFATAPRTKNGVTQVSSSMALKLKNFFSVTEKNTLYRIGAILIDPGHGGKDVGCIGSYVENEKNIILYEKDIALKVSLDLYAMLKNTYPDKTIMLTRSKDVYPELEDRVNMANKVKLKKNESILYISVHVNAAINSKARGFEVWYLPTDYRREVLDKNMAPKEIHTILNSMMEEEFSTESVLLAQSILKSLDYEIGTITINRGIRANPYFVIRNVKMPSVLVEIGFISNKADAKLLGDPSHLKKCTVGIYNGIYSFVNKFENGENTIGGAD